MALLVIHEFSSVSTCGPIARRSERWISHRRRDIGEQWRRPRGPSIELVWAWVKSEMLHPFLRREPGAKPAQSAKAGQRLPDRGWSECSRLRVEGSRGWGKSTCRWSECNCLCLPMPLKSAATWLGGSNPAKARPKPAEDRGLRRANCRPSPRRQPRGAVCELWDPSGVKSRLRAPESGVRSTRIRWLNSPSKPLVSAAMPTRSHSPARARSSREGAGQAEETRGAKGNLQAARLAGAGRDCTLVIVPSTAVRFEVQSSAR